MSSRVLRKLQGDNDLELRQQPDEQNSDMEVDLAAAGPRKKQLNVNRYDLLNQQSPSESEVKEDDNETEAASAANNVPDSVSKKKKKKRKKKSSKHGGHTISSEDNENQEKFLKDIDPFLSVSGKGNKSPRVHISLPPPALKEADKALLKVEYKNLNPQNEMRRTFGKRVVKIENKRGRQKPTFKSTFLVTARDMWPPVSKDIIFMKPCKSPEKSEHLPGITWFAYEHSKFYQGVENMFSSAVERMDSDFLVRVIKRCPYHVNSLIQLSDLCRVTENYAMASELIERAVLVLESSLHPTFSLISGNCRLDYRREENRALFIVLFKHAQYLEGRACSRTAFEISKLILNLDPDVDPLAILLVIDYYALRCKQYQWLIRFYEEWKIIKNLSQLPNMAYSYALALFLTNSSEADEALQYALLMFPGVLRPLLDELSVCADKRVTSHNYFIPGITSSQSPALHQLTSLYVCRAKIVWKEANVLLWLEKNVNIVLDRVDKKDEIIKEYNMKRSQRYVNPPRAILRHVILADFKEKVPLAPFISTEKDPIMTYDPLPPLDSINFYDRKQTTGSNSSPTETSSGPLSMFFQSMLPSFNLDRAQQNRNNDDNTLDLHERIGAAVDDLDGAAVELDAAAAFQGDITAQRFLPALTSVMDAMRDFLSNIHITEGLMNQNEDDGDESESSEEDSGDYYD